MDEKILQVRNFPDDLRRHLKMIALETDRPLKDVIVEALWDYVIKTKKGRK